MRESGVRGGVNLVQSSFSHSLVYNRVSKYMGHSEDSIAPRRAKRSASSVQSHAVGSNNYSIYALYY